jgi:dTDP-4-dehydrorhamnose 3,5-epimerase-like enzyme
MEMPAEVIVEQRAPFVDARGEIRNLVDVPFSSASIITSVPGAVRANHYHLTDWHYCWMQKGRVDYYHRPVGDTNPPQKWTIEEGQIFFTPPMFEHAMVFLEDSVMFVMAKNNREMANYEADTVRVELVKS